MSSALIDECEQYSLQCTTTDDFINETVHINAIPSTSDS